MAFGLSYRQVIVTLDREVSRAGVQGDELSALGRGPHASELERQWMEAELFREREEREGGCQKTQRAAGDGSGGTIFKWGRERSSRQCEDLRGQDGTGSGNKRAFRFRCTGLTP